MLTHALLTPHAPALIPAIGGEHTRLFQQTINALISTTLQLKLDPPETVVVLTPHAEILPGAFTIRTPESGVFVTSFAEFGAPEIRYEFPADRVLAAQLSEAVVGSGLPITSKDDADLDYGTAVPLHYLQAVLPTFSLVSLGVSLAGAREHYLLGRALRQVCDETDKKIVFIASSELSHKLTKHSPHGFEPAAATWDKQMLAALKAGDSAAILADDSLDRDRVGECGYRGLTTLLGLVDELNPLGQSVETERGSSKNPIQILSYESPTGIGCAVAIWSK